MVLKELRLGGWRGVIALSLALLFSSAVSGQTVLSLHEAIDRALHGPAASLYAAQVDEARGSVRQAGLRPNPLLYLSSEDLRPWNNQFSFANNTEDFGYVGQTIEVGGKRGRRIDLASARVRYTEAQQALRLQQLAIQVAGSYWGAEAGQRIVTFLRQDLAAMDDLVQYNKSRVDAGAMRGIDLMRMQIERDRVLLTLRAAERDSSLARVELLKLIGGAPAAEVQLTDRIEDIVAVEPVSLDVALERRADVRSAREAIAASQADLRLQTANRLPDPNLLLGYKRNSGFDTGYGSLQLPLPFSNRNQGEIARARASVTVAQASLQLVQQQVRADLEAAQQYYGRERELVQQTLPEMRERARTNLQVLTEAYRAGGVDLLRYLDAERTEIDVEVNALRTLTEFHQSVLRLQQAYGVQP